MTVVKQYSDGEVTNITGLFQDLFHISEENQNVTRHTV
jgi:hypothetical protein